MTVATAVAAHIALQRVAGVATPSNHLMEKRNLCNATLQRTPLIAVPPLKGGTLQRCNEKGVRNGE